MRDDCLILVAEDDLTLRYLSKRQFAALGYVCEIANDGEEAVKMANAKHYDLIFMDIHMPKMNGLDAARAIRKFEKDSKREGYVPIVALTANPERQQCFDAGMNDFIFKPVTLDGIEKMLARWLPSDKR